MSMGASKRFECPSCGFSVFNRRVSNCESCGAVLPEALRLTPKDLALLDAEHQRIAKQRADLAKEEQESQRKRAARREGGG